MEIALYSVFLCGLYHRNLPGLNLKHICFRVCQLGYYFAILVLLDFYVKVFFCLHSAPPKPIYFFLSLISICSKDTKKKKKEFEVVLFLFEKHYGPFRIKSFLHYYPLYPFVMSIVYIVYGAIGSILRNDSIGGWKHILLHIYM